jgi:hypothetical protein
MPVPLLDILLVNNLHFTVPSIGEEWNAADSIG